MKTRYKILTVIAITLSVYVGINLIVYSCDSISECEIVYNLHSYVGIIAITPMCEYYESTDLSECDVESYELRFQNDFYFFSFFIIIPISVIAIIWYKDRK